MKRRNILRTIGTVSAVIALAVAGQFATTSSAEAQGRFTLATSQPGGAWYPMAAGLVSMYNDKIPNTVWTVEKGGGSSNNKTLSLEKVEFAWVSGDMMHLARKGEKPFDKKYDQTHFRVIGQMPASDSHWVVMKNSSIKSLADLRGKRVAIAKRGSSANRRAFIMLGLYGVTDKDLTPSYIGDDQASKALVDGRIDASIDFIPAPAPPVASLSTTHDIRLLAMEPDKAAELRKKFPYFAPLTIKAGTYRGVDKDVPTFGVPGWYLVLDRVPDDVVYQATKVLFENIKTLMNVHPAFDNIEMNPIAKSVTTHDLHPGALKYYKEKGVL